MIPKEKFFLKIVQSIKTDFISLNKQKKKKKSWTFTILSKPI